MKATEGFGENRVTWSRLGRRPPIKKEDLFDYRYERDRSNAHSSVLVLVVSEERQRTVLVMSTERDDPKWRLPGGGIAAGETPEEAGAREVEEETGIPLQASAVTVLLPERREKHRYWPHLCAAQVSEEDFGYVLAQTVDDGEVLTTRVLEVNELMRMHNLLQQHRKRLEEAFPSPQWAT